MIIIIFWGDLTDTSAKKEALCRTEQQYCLMIATSVFIQAKTSVMSPRKSLILLPKLKITGSRYPRKKYFNFENKITDHKALRNINCLNTSGFKKRVKDLRIPERFNLIMRTTSLGTTSAISCKTVQQSCSCYENHPFRIATPRKATIVLL